MNRIKFFRQQKSMTVKKLSEKSGIAVGYVSDLENNNKSNPSREVMKKISAALGQTVMDVFFPEEIHKEVC
ncbi:HTH-type transcriptional regulator SinR [Clostridium botulinum C str. Eklund]|nr:HTH-type transcriptional regulator SinR [Clostridium botulinum C str. Eklund]NEZ49830.1 helix-turn-helix transcriptional regulator [Clostridium botulinum]